MADADTSPAPSFGGRFRLTLITNDPTLAAEADAAGVNRIGVDLESLGKTERQAGHDTRISGHAWDDLVAVGRVVRRADRFVRINPVHAGTQAEVETALRLGAGVLMLPNFETADEVATFVESVGRRARAIILVERVAAAARIREILGVPGIDEVMFGLNDLRLDCRLTNAFEMLASPLMDLLAAEVRAAGLPLAVGGVACVDDTTLPVPPDVVLAQYPRLGATGAWLGRSFCARASFGVAHAVRGIRDRLDEWAHAPPEALAQAREALTHAAIEWRNGRPSGLVARR